MANCSVPKFCRIGYGLSCISRQKLLEIMSGRLQGKGLIRTSSRVVSLQEEEDHVTITTIDGFSVTADLVVGADGIRSSVRDFIDSSKVEKRVESDQCELSSTENVAAFIDKMTRYVYQFLLCLWHLRSYCWDFSGRELFCVSGRSFCSFFNG